MENDSQSYVDVEPILEAEVVRRSRALKWFLVILVFFLALGTPLAFIVGVSYYQNSLEFHAPELQIVRAPSSVGLSPSPLNIRFRDDGSGLRTIKVELFQGTRRHELLVKDFPEPTPSYEVEVPLKFDGRTIQEGPIRIAASAWDATKWNNKNDVYIDLNVDTTPPTIRVLNKNLRLEQGGLGLVFIEATDFSPFEVGIEMGSWKFSAKPAIDLDSGFDKTDTDLYYCLFGVPSDASQGASIMAVGADNGGNLSKERIQASISPLSTKRKSAAIDPKSLPSKKDILAEELKVDLIKNYIKANPGVSKIPDDVMVLGLQQGLWFYTRDRQKYWDDLKIQNTATRFWKTPFTFSYGKRNVLAFFGDEISWYVSEKSIGTSPNLGLLLKAEEDLVVRAANSGQVIFHGNLGPYGVTVIINHGLGLTTSYHHLSYSPLSVGSQVKAGDVVGDIGSSGLGFFDGALIEMRIQGKPVNPLFLADETVLLQDFTRIISTAKAAL